MDSPVHTALWHLSNSDKDGINFLYTPDLGDAPHRDNVYGNEFSTRVHGTTNSRTLNGVQLHAAWPGASHKFGLAPLQGGRNYTYEWIGADLSGECEARVTDTFDDGVVFNPNPPQFGANLTITVNVHTAADARGDTHDYATDSLYVNAWLDYKDVNGKWEEANGEHIMSQSRAAAGDWSPSVTVLLPETPQPIWLRVRLDWGENCNEDGLATDLSPGLNLTEGAAQFGEVEDYLIAGCRPPDTGTKTEGKKESRNTTDRSSLGPQTHVIGGPGDTKGMFETPSGDPFMNGWWRVGRQQDCLSDIFAQLMEQLEDIDPCLANDSPQVGFIDDGAIVPGTGGYPCLTWCYGPNGYIVNPEGGLAGPENHLWNEVWSPVLAWPEGDYSGAWLEFDVWRHEELIPDVSPGMFYVWHVRSTTDPEGLYGWSEWGDYDLAYYGGPDYFRHQADVSSLLTADVSFVQIALGVLELGWLWNYTGTDGTPAPYFDNVELVAYEAPGPAIHAREIDLAQDNFPASGTINCGDACENSVRFDMAANIALPDESPCNLPGDSIVFDIAAVRAGTVLGGSELHYRLNPNPIFDACRSSVPPGPGNTPFSGYVTSDAACSSTRDPQANRFCFDLPDTGFFFPGDVIHYYVRARDSGGGVATLPGDTTGYSSFPGDPDYVMLQYPSPYVVRALPSLTSLSPCQQVPMLWWNDFGDRGLENEWMHSLWCLGLHEGSDFDVYYTNGPSSGIGNGLGGRASASQLAGYDMLLYSSGDLSVYTLSSGDCVTDPSEDIAVLDAWLRQGNNCLFLSGNELIYDLHKSSGATVAFSADWIQCDFIDHTHRGLLSPGSPTVQAFPFAGNPIFTDALRWAANTSCDGTARMFDVVEATGYPGKIAEWLATPYCVDGAYSYTAAIYNDGSTLPVDTDKVIVLPYDLGLVRNETTCGGNPTGSGCTVRADLLRDVLTACGVATGSQTVGVPVPVPAAFSVQSYPNPFNPTVRIVCEVPRDGKLHVRIFNVRGELVATLIDEVVQPGSHDVFWDGKDAGG
ncbi:MAG: GEVED domain-containing protein, partial [bacterium]